MPHALLSTTRGREVPHRAANRCRSAREVEVVGVIDRDVRGEQPPDARDPELKPVPVTRSTRRLAVLAAGDRDAVADVVLRQRAQVSVSAVPSSRFEIACETSSPSSARVIGEARKFGDPGLHHRIEIRLRPCPECSTEPVAAVPWYENWSHLADIQAIFYEIDIDLGRTRPWRCGVVEVIDDPQVILGRLMKHDDLSE